MDGPATGPGEAGREKAAAAGPEDAGAVGLEEGMDGATGMGETERENAAAAGPGDAGAVGLGEGMDGATGMGETERENAAAAGPGDAGAVGLEGSMDGPAIGAGEAERKNVAVVGPGDAGADDRGVEPALDAEVDEMGEGGWEQSSWSSSHPSSSMAEPSSSWAACAPTIGPAVRPSARVCVRRSWRLPDQREGEWMGTYHRRVVAERKRATAKFGRRATEKARRYVLVLEQKKNRTASARRHERHAQPHHRACGETQRAGLRALFAASLKPEVGGRWARTVGVWWRKEKGLTAEFGRWQKAKEKWQSWGGAPQRKPCRYVLALVRRPGEKSAYRGQVVAETKRSDSGNRAGHKSDED
ncbi:hypothetical protein B0H17DRAFT_1139518 [Mycena rosella]|uniref:Uncharacterized protein n=1 Tax=Mycena rosella TaxID=1033263 RepID=A0AAD7GD12_MYCRO|nr:hypothetical protein B0H17DRAFT_1139518 [Mycena rosella]